MCLPTAELFLSSQANQSLVTSPSPNMADSTADLEAQYNSSMHQERGSLLTHPELPPWIQTPSLALATPSEKNQSTHKGDTLEVEPDI